MSLGWISSLSAQIYSGTFYECDNSLHDFSDADSQKRREVLDSQDIVDFLLDQGVDINATEDNGFVIQVASAPFTPHKRTTEPHPDHFDHSVRVLNRASRLGYIKMFDHLVSRGADPTRSIALHEACFCKSASRAVAMITHLVQNHNFDVNGTSEPEGVRKVCWNPAIFEGAPLGWAVYRENLLGSGDDTVVEALLALGAEPGDATELAAICGTMTALETLIKAGGSATDALACAVINNKVDAARLCLRYGADRNEVEGTERMSEEMKELLETHK